MKRNILVAVLVIALLGLSLAGYTLFQSGPSAGQEEGISEGMPVPGYEDVEETVIDSEMPVPGHEEDEEMVVGSEMPVPGLEGVEETIVEEN